MSASNKEQKMSKQLPCSLVVERALTVAGIERKAILSCGPDQHHIYCPAYYQNLIDDAEAALAELQERPVCDCHTWPTWGEMHSYIEALERKLAECEQQRDALQAHVIELSKYINHAEAIERKLAAAREVTLTLMRSCQCEGTGGIDRLGETIQCPGHEQSLCLAREGAKIVAALTEAGEKAAQNNDADHWYYCETCDIPFRTSGTFRYHRNKDCKTLALFPGVLTEAGEGEK